MGRLLKVARRDRVYIVLGFVLVSFNLMMFSAWLGTRSVERQEIARYASPEEAREYVEEAPVKTDLRGPKVEERARLIEEISRENPMLYFLLAVVNLSIFFIILVGLILDAYLLIRARKKEPLDVRLASSEQVHWGVSDVLRAVIVFVFFGYLFAFLQAVLSGFFPILRNPNFRMISDTAFMGMAGIAVIFYFVFFKYAQGASAIGLSRVHWGKAALTAAAGYAAVVPALVGIMVATFFVIRAIGYEPDPQPIVEVFIEEKKVPILWMSTFFAAVFGPVAEEIFFRGFMYPAVKKKWGMAAGVLGTSVIFSLLHAHTVGFLPIMVLGVFLVYLYERTGSLVVPMIAHIIHNAGMIVLVFLARGIGA